MGRGFNGFGGGGGFGNMQSLMKQAQKMQEQMAKAQEELDEMEIEAGAGGGMVQIVMSGKKVLKSIKIDPTAVDADDVEMLEDLIIAAVNDGYAKAEAAYEEKMGPYAGMMG